jgi:hypothetical protein
MELSRYRVKEAGRSTYALAVLGTSIGGDEAKGTNLQPKNNEVCGTREGKFNRRKFGGRSTNATTRTQTIF